MDSRVGRKLNMLTVLEKAEAGKYLCRCDCGVKKVVAWEHLRRGSTKSCGCLRGYVAPAMPRFHSAEGIRKHALYQTWRGMLRRCYDQKHDAYGRYGGRGVVVHQAWREDFWAFAAAVGDRPSDQHTLDRIDNNGNYEPGNVRWASPTEQYLNSSGARGVLVDGVVMTVPQALKKFGANPDSAAMHIRKSSSVAYGVARALLAKRLHALSMAGESVDFVRMLGDKYVKGVMTRFKIEDVATP